jgi:shikimate kinase
VTVTKTAKSQVHGAISIVNAIATGKGSALGISLKVSAEVKLQKGRGIRFISKNNEDSLIKNIVQRTIPKEIIEDNMITISIDSEIPIGYGLKSSSAVSNAVALACGCIGHNSQIDDYAILDAAVRSSLESQVSLTGAYDDASACYFGGFTVTDNYAGRILRKESTPENLYAIIILPPDSSRGDIKMLRKLSDLFEDAFQLAESGQYWKAMKLNGVLASAALSSSYRPVLDAMEHGALSASTSGNGPAIAAVAYRDTVEDIVQGLSKFDGKIIVSKASNEKASVTIIDD